MIAAQHATSVHVRTSRRPHRTTHMTVNHTRQLPRSVPWLVNAIPDLVEASQPSTQVIEPLQGPGIQLNEGELRNVQYVPDGKPGFFTVRGSMLLRQDPSLVWDLLTDYERPGVFSNIAASQMHVKPGGKIELKQSCTWSFLTFSGSFDIHLSVDEDHDNKQLLFKLIQSSFMRDFEGSWQVSPVTIQDGSIQQPGCMVTHVLSVKPIVPVPPPFSYYTRSIFEKQVDGVLTDLENELQRQTASRQ